MFCVKRCANMLLLLSVLLPVALLRGMGPEGDLQVPMSLHEIIVSGRTAGIRQLIESIPHVNARNTLGRTPLHEAARYGRLDCAFYLCRHGADVTAQDSDGLTPLHHAAHIGACGVVAMLLKMRASVDATDANGLTPLDHARLCKQHRVVRILFEHNERRNAQYLEALRLMVGRASWQ